MTRDGKPITPRAPDNAPSPILSYSGPGPLSLANQVVFNRQRDTLTILIPGGSVVVKIVVRVVWLTICLAMIALLLIVPIAVITSGDLRNGAGYAICPVIGIAFLVLGVISCIRSIIRLFRAGRHPLIVTVVTVGPGGIEVRVTGKTWPIILHVERAQIAHLQIHPTVGGLSNRLMLEVIARDDSLHVASIPWPRGYPMIALEDNIRDVLGLAAGDAKS